MLLAHPDPDVRQRIGGPIGDAGLEVVEVAGVQAAVEHAVAVVPDVVVMGTDHPDLDPARAIAAMQSDDHLIDVPVVVLSTTSDDPSAIDALAAGAHDILTSTSAGPETVARVEAALTVRRLHGELRQRAAELANVARVDPLTGLSTRRHTEEDLHMVASSARRQGHRIAAVLIDIDHLRRVNADLAREAGDAVLREVSRRLIRAMRTDDVAGRWGGEEFLLVLPESSVRGARDKAETIRAAITQLALVYEGKPLGKLSASLGVAVFPHHGDTAEELIRAADEALYKAKESGRNRVVLAPTAPELLAETPSPN